MDRTASSPDRRPGWERLLELLDRASVREREKGGDGWCDPWEVVDRWHWGTNMPLGFVPSAAERAWDALRRRGLIEEDQRGLVRPANKEAR